MSSEPTTQTPRVRRGLLWGIALGALLLGGVSWFLWPKDPPHIQTSPALYDFGQIGAKDKVETIVTVRNAGGRPLEILSVTTSCGCTKAKLEREKLAPGQETSLKITFDAASHSSEGMANRSAPEAVSHVVFLRSNDPAQPEVSVEIRAQLVPPKELP